MPEFKATASKKRKPGLGAPGEKISGKTHRPARFQLVIDRLKYRKCHHVEEQDESRHWKTEHYEDVPLGEKKK